MHSNAIYSDLASWWPLFSSPAEYAEEADCALQLLRGESSRPLRSVLELGSGGGNNAFHLKQHFDLTLVDVSAEMLAVSQALNPECEHVQGDMRTVRLKRTFDAVFVHDAVMYMTTEGDLRAAIETAFVHCRPGGVALFEPDCVRETFEPDTEHGGEDDPVSGRGIRWVQWSWDPDPTDSSFVVDYGYLLREADGLVRVEHDRHINGVFGRAVWLDLLRGVGFNARSLPDPWRQDVFLASRPV